MKIKSAIYFIFFIFFLYLFAVYNVNFRGPDEPIYFAYTASMVEDGDLNLANQVYSKSTQFNISKTYNLPDFHDPGGVILWAPFYAYAKAIYFIATKLNLTTLTSYRLDRLTRCAMSFSTIVFGFLTLLLTYFLCRVFFSSGISLWSALILFFGTPFFYYTLFETGNANIIACLFSILLIWFCSYAMSMKRSHWFLYGLFFSICTMVKTELWFQMFFIFLIFIVLVMLKQTPWRNGIYFLVGLGPGLLLRIINDYIKYGAFHIEEFNQLNLKDSYFFEQLFASYRGFFYTSPIFYICLLGFIFIVINLAQNIKRRKVEKIMDNLFFIILTLFLVIKIIFLGHRYAWGGGTCGARPLLTEFPVFALLFARAFQGQRKYIQYFIFIISIFSIFWNLLIISEYMAGLDLKYVAGFPGLDTRIKTLKYILGPLFYIKDLDLKLRLNLPLLLGVFGIIFYIIKRFTDSISPSFWYVRDQNRRQYFNVFFFFTTYLCAAYIVITAFNISNNKRNAERLIADGFFEKAKIIGTQEFEKDENVASMDEMIEYFKLKGDIDRINKIKRCKKEIYGENDK